MSSGDFVDLGFEWQGLQTLGVAISFRQEGDDIRDKTMSVRYYISSVKLMAKEFAEWGPLANQGSITLETRRCNAGR